MYLKGPVLGIETSCDETAVAVVVGKNVRSNIVSSQADLHRKWGGVVPEAAARKHAENIIPVLAESLSAAAAKLDDLAGIAVTNRPGLVGALSVGATAAKGLSVSLDVPLIGVHHLEAHVLSAFMEADVPVPHVCLLVSGGHTELLLVRRPGQYVKLGGTIDDAAGEAFDKAARALGLGYPGGPAIQNAAKTGDEAKYSFPRGLDDPTFDFSFAGLKTAVRVLVESEGDRLDLSSAAAAFQAAVASVLADRAAMACRKTGASAVTLVGGVAANHRLRDELSDRANSLEIPMFVPRLSLCTDNAAMIAHAGSWRLAAGERSAADMEVEAVSPLPAGESNE